MCKMEKTTVDKVSSNIKNGGGIVLNLLWLRGCVLTSPALEVKLRTKVAFYVPEGPSDCAKDLGELGSPYTPLPLSGKAQNVLSHLMGMRVRV